ATIRETTLQHAVELALDLVQAAQDQEEAVGAGHDHQSNSERKKEAPAFTSGRASIGRELRSSAPVWESGRRRVLPPTADPPLVAQTPFGDFFIGAKDLFVGANRTHR